MNNEHGANIFEISKELKINLDKIIDFSSNINPYGASENAKEYIKNNLDLVSIYPDPNYKDLKLSISKYCKIDQEYITLGNGATEFINSFINIITPTNTLLLSPVYSEYEKELKKVNSNIFKMFHKKENNFKINIQDILNFSKNNNIDFIVLCNPNNPTGFAFSNKEIELLLASFKGTLMIDETYIEFTDINLFSSINLLKKYENLFIIRGTSKFFATPGIRLGYSLCANKNIQKKLNQLPNLWNINIIAETMGKIMFSDKKYIVDTKLAIKNSKDFIFSTLKKFKNIHIYPSESNFFLCEILNKDLTSDLLYEFLLKKNFIIRNAKSFEGLDNSFFRFCILDSRANLQLINLLIDFFQEEI